MGEKKYLEVTDDENALTYEVIRCRVILADSREDLPRLLREERGGGGGGGREEGEKRVCLRVRHGDAEHMRACWHFGYGGG